jgi:phospholipid/cholesterol/gamma-HCH transport system ATP-binding protein
VLGEAARRSWARGAASRVGMLFQHGALFSAFSVLDNIAFPLRELKTLPPELIRDAAWSSCRWWGWTRAATRCRPTCRAA